MIVDLIENMPLYAGVHPMFMTVYEFVNRHDVASLPSGRMEIDGDNLYVNVQQTAPRKRDEAVLESHNRYVDIQIPVDRQEYMGYTPRAGLPEAAYHADGDYTLYDGCTPDSMVCVKPGMFAAFFPADGHAPCISDEGVHKMVFKLKVKA